jgi:acetolactate synthase-1/2/3 large subunit
MQRSGAQLIIDFLEQRGVRFVAGMPGGANLPLYDALQASSIRHVLVRHEQAAGFIAQGMARAWTRSLWSRSRVRCRRL